MKKYFIFVFTSALLTRIWYSDIFQNYSYSLPDVLLALIIFYGVSWLLWKIGSIFIALFANGLAIINKEKSENPHSFKDFISWFIAGITFLLLISLISKIFS